VHQRFSTNTFPAWSLGASLPDESPITAKINTLRGKRQLDGGRAKASVHSELYGKDISRLWPIFL